MSLWLSWLAIGCAVVAVTVAGWALSCLVLWTWRTVGIRREIRDMNRAETLRRLFLERK